MDGYQQVGQPQRGEGVGMCLDLCRASNVRPSTQTLSVAFLQQFFFIL
jgi:hypothetical protein